MSLTGTTNDYVQSLISVGADAMTNLFYLEFVGGKMGSEYSSQHLKVRSGNFKAPTFTQGTNEFHHMTVSVNMPKAEITGTKELSFTFRVDENFLVYKTLLAQKKVTSISNLGYAVNDIPSDTGNDGSFITKVYAYDGKGTIGDPDSTSFKLLYQFNHCWVKNVKGLTFGYDSSNPITAQATVGFLDFDDPQNLLASSGFGK